MLRFIAAIYLLLAGHGLLSQEISLPDAPSQKDAVMIASNRSATTGNQESTPAASSSKSDAIPDAPSAQVPSGAPSVQSGVQPADTSQFMSSSNAAKVEHKAGTTFWITTGIVFVSTVANAEVIARCVPTSCQSIPPAIRSRGALYGIGIPASAGVSYLSYRMKRDGSKWWFIPAAIFAQANFIYAVHSAPWTR